MAGVTDNPNAAASSHVEFANELSKNYLNYAISVITARALPDVRDGLKPVQRRLLWAMRQLGLETGQDYRSSARVIGEVMGKYHPHSDRSIYDVLVRFAQPFALRYPLVDGEGNFGSVDDNQPAAYRYTKAALTQVAIDLMSGIDEGSVDFVPSYNGDEAEPRLLPGPFPNLLANGAGGIGVGMATSIPPHNVAEILDAAILLIDQPEATDAQVRKLVKGPDFPTGGVIIETPDAITKTYATGRGSFRVRARWALEERGGRTWQVVVTEIAPGIQKTRLVGQLSALISVDKLAELAGVRDESDVNLRIIIEPSSRAVDPGMLMERLFELSDLEARVPFNLNVIDEDHVPRVLSLKQAITAWVNHQLIVVRRRAECRRAMGVERSELVEGYLTVLPNVDQVMEALRSGRDLRKVMIEELGFTQRQASAIARMPLADMEELDASTLCQQRDTLKVEQADLTKLLSSESLQRSRLKSDLINMRGRYGPDTPIGGRRTEVSRPFDGSGNEEDAILVEEASHQSQESILDGDLE